MMRVTGRRARVGRRRRLSASSADETKEKDLSIIVGWIMGYCSLSLSS